jgi:hypothetical protein
MPAVTVRVTTEEERRNEKAISVNPEDEKLWLPSELTVRERRGGCRRGLQEMEIRLRQAQCGETLRKIRHKLYAKRHLTLFRKTHVCGQRQGTRSLTLITKLGLRINSLAERYRAARRALISLGEREEQLKWRELKAEDLRLEDEIDEDAAGTQKLNLLGSNKTRMQRWIKKGREQKKVSWIWMALSGVEEEGLEEKIHEGEFFSFVQKMAELSKRSGWSGAKQKQGLRGGRKRLCYLRRSSGEYLVSYCTLNRFGRKGQSVKELAWMMR